MRFLFLLFLTGCSFAYKPTEEFPTIQSAETFCQKRGGLLRYAQYTAIQNVVECKDGTRIN